LTCALEHGDRTLDVESRTLRTEWHERELGDVLVTELDVILELSSSVFFTNSISSWGERNVHPCDTQQGSM
jgi:hypothetical protein